MRDFFTLAGLFACILAGFAVAEFVASVPALTIIVTVIFFVSLFAGLIKLGMWWVNR